MAHSTIKAVLSHVMRPMACIFGDKNLDILFVTSSSPLPNGRLYAIEAGMHGLSETLLFFV